MIVSPMGRGSGACYYEAPAFFKCWHICFLAARRREKGTVFTRFCARCTRVHVCTTQPVHQPARVAGGMDQGSKFRRDTGGLRVVGPSIMMRSKHDPVATSACSPPLYYAFRGAKSTRYHTFLSIVIPT
jgi:hypothetical protein